MTSGNPILIKNVYYMLTYAFRELRQSGYEETGAEEFETIHDLFAALLGRGISKQLKKGLYREYTTRWEDIPGMKGKLCFPQTIRSRLQRKQLLSCEYDELLENNVFNQILKTTAMLLLRQPSAKEVHRKRLKKLMLFFQSVDYVEPSEIRWNQLTFQRSNQSYEMLIGLCYYVLKGLLLSPERGQYKMASFLDDQLMCRLYEKFVLQYYKTHHPFLSPSAPQVKWNVDDGIREGLPVMQTDIVLKQRGKILIIDTKYYSHTMQSQYGKSTLHSNNLYQIFAYVKNQDVQNTGNVAGLLLYAKTNESMTPDHDFLMNKNPVSVKTLDLNKDFPQIREQLDRIAAAYFTEKG